MNRIMIFRRKNKGLSLLESILAVGLVMSVTIASITMSIYTTRVGKASENKLIAVNLAREPIEVARNLRDSNWLAGLAWNSGVLGSGGCANWCTLNYLPLTAPNPNDDWQWSFTNYGSNITTCTATNTSRLKISSRGVYNYDATGSYSKFCRVVKISEVSSVVTITSKVVWEENGRVKDVILEEQLKNWRE